MFLYHLTLSKASGIQSAIYGNFSAPKAQEIVVSRGKVLELLRPDDAGKVQVICSTEVFGTIRAILPFRLTGASKDYIVVGSDSGRIVVLEYVKDTGAFKKIHQETFGKSGCRRIVPGQYLAVDPKGRACMLGAVEKQKFVYVLNRDSAANLTISSPLEAHKSHTLVFSLAGLDQGFDNPMFAALELDYGDVDADPSGEAAAEAQKHLTLYELDLGLNHVVRKHSQPIDNGANLLVPVPGGGDGPGGVLVCADNFIIYAAQDHPDVRAVIPRRTSLPADRGVLLTAFATHKQKASVFFFLVQSEYGDIYKVTLKWTQSPLVVTEVIVQYFDTIPTAVSLCVLRTGFLFAASEFGNHALYQFQSVGDDDDSATSSSASLVQSEEGYQPVFFDPRPLRNLAPIDEADNLAPITDLKVANLTREETPQLYTLCGRGPRSTLRALRPGLAVTELAVSPVPGVPTGVFTIRRSVADLFDAYIIVSFSNATLVLSIGETVDEVQDSGFSGSVATLRVQLLDDSSMLQVHANGLRHIRADRRINEWRAPGRKQIVHAASNTRQVIIALTGGELIYFELSAVGQLLETEKATQRGEVSALDVAPVAPGRLRAPFLAVGSHDSTIRMLGLDADNALQQVALQQVPSVPESLLLLEAAASDVGGKGGGEGGPQGIGRGVTATFLHAGLANGVLMRTEVDGVTGQLSDTRQRFLGPRPAQLSALAVREKRSLLALSTRPWLGYSEMGRHTMSPLSYEALDFAAGFSSDQCPEGICAVSGKTLRILAIERLGQTFNQQVARLRYTPRKLLVHAESGSLIVAEADMGVPSAAQRVATGDLTEAEAARGVEADAERAALEDQQGGPRGAATEWASCLRLLNPQTLATHSVLELEGGEAALSLCLVRFAAWASEGPLLAVGTVQGLAFSPRSHEEGFIRLYRILDSGTRLDLLHKTAVGGIPGALCGFKGRLLAGVGPVLRLYECGRKKLLRKCEHRRLPTHIATLAALGDRIYVGDLQESLHYFKYKASENVLYEFADDMAPRHLTAALPLDYDSVAIADKFGNVSIGRLPADVSAQVEEDPTGGKFANIAQALNGAPHKVEAVINFHVGDLVTALQPAALPAGGRTLLLYATIMGGIGALLPFVSREDVDFFSHLEMHLRQEHPPLCGRDHLAFRGTFFPVKDVVDGDLCEQFSALPYEKQRAIAEELENRTPGEVLKKLEDIRNQIL